MCYGESQLTDSCAITDIRMIENESTDFSDYQTLAYNDTYRIVYSKTFDSRPITSFRIENQPCISPYDQNQVEGQEFYPAENTNTTCTQDSFTGFTYDDRYRTFGLY